MTGRAPKRFVFVHLDSGRGKSVNKADLDTCAAKRFPDGEIGIDLREPPGKFHRAPPSPLCGTLVELLRLADACRWDGATCITAVIRAAETAALPRDIAGAKPSRVAQKAS